MVRETIQERVSLSYLSGLTLSYFSKEGGDDKNKQDL
jgi:hypothetical protein